MSKHTIQANTYIPYVGASGSAKERINRGQNIMLNHSKGADLKCRDSNQVNWGIVATYFISGDIVCGLAKEWQRCTQ